MSSTLNRSLEAAPVFNFQNNIQGPFQYEDCLSGVRIPNIEIKQLCYLYYGNPCWSGPLYISLSEPEESDLWPLWMSVGWSKEIRD